MLKVYSENKIPIKSWCENIEDGALEQANNLANLPFAFRHIALMPDAHLGYGMPIGGVLATKDVIIPNAVGVDIGCGVACCKLPIRDITKDQIRQVFGGSKENKGGVRSLVPVGFKHHSKKQNMKYMPKDGFSYSDNTVDLNYESALKQIGTLGGGNHFIEIQKGSDGYLYIMIHSGSRNLGYKVAKHYNDLAKELNKKWFTSVDPKFDLAFLPMNSQEGQNYLAEMKYCVEFAKASRELMMKRCLKSLDCIGVFDFRDIQYYDVAHNYVEQEHHFGQNVWVHRKGATKAYEGVIGLIPGSQGTNSYIVKGLGNKESFKSCSHGAGRTMSRKKAKEKLNLEEEIKKIDDQGIVHGMRNKSNLDEASSAYKDIHMVMENQKDLVEVLVELAPLGVIKG